MDIINLFWLHDDSLCSLSSFVLIFEAGGTAFLGYWVSTELKFDVYTSNLISNETIFLNQKQPSEISTIIVVSSSRKERRKTDLFNSAEVS